MVQCPTYCNKLAKSLGKKMEACRKKYGLTPQEAAKELGIHEQAYIDISEGKYVPQAWIQRRISRWALHHHVFNKSYRARTYGQIAKLQGFKSVRVRLPGGMQKRLVMAAQKMGLTMEEFTALAIEQLLDNTHGLITYDKAIERLRWVLVAQALTENPESRYFLEEDLDRCAELGATLVKKEPVELGPKRTIVDEVLDMGDDPWEVFET